MPTDCLFREDAYLRNCDAEVVAITDRGGIVLDRTVFYATSGGQPGDSGMLMTEAGVEIPIATVVCIGLLLSTITRNSAAAVVGTLMVSLLFQLIGILPGLGALKPYLLSSQFTAWQGLLRTPIDWAPILRALWVCSLYVVPAMVAAINNSVCGMIETYFPSPHL